MSGKIEILHIAPQNTAGVPMAFVKAERRMGFASRLITMGPNLQERDEDIELRLPFFSSVPVRLAKQFLIPGSSKITNRVELPETLPPVWKPGRLSRSLFSLREQVWGWRLNRLEKELDLSGVRLIQLDGGMEFYRDGRWLRRMKERGLIVVCCYTGSDLRVRGVIPEIHALSDLNVTVEFDHLKFFPELRYIPFPLDVDRFEPAAPPASGPFRVGHAPTRRQAKGTETILSILNDLRAKHDVEPVLIENLAYAEAIRLKSTCHCFVDQLGDLGYGMNAVEALSMGIPTCSSLVSGFAEAFPDHPLIEVDAESLKEAILHLIQDPAYRRNLGIRSMEWVKRQHRAENSVSSIHMMAGLQHCDSL